MVNYVLRRLLTGVVVFISVTALTFVMLFAPGGYDIARSFLSDSATPEQIAARADELGLLRPLPTQYLEWLGGVLTGDLGRSFVNNAEVTEIIASRAPVTISLLVVSLLLTVVVAVPVGVASATRGGLVDRMLQSLSVLVQSIPNFGVALILVLLFALWLAVLPATGYIPIDRSVTGWAMTIVLPSIAIAVGSIAFVAAQIRGAMLDALRLDFIRTLRSRGISRWSIVYKHALRTAAPPTMTVLSLQVIQIFGGSVIVERVFALPGLGSITLSAGVQGDIPVVLGAVTFVVVVIVLVNLAVDIVNGLLSPKARIQ